MLNKMQFLKSCNSRVVQNPKPQLDVALSLYSPFSVNTAAHTAKLTDVLVSDLRRYLKTPVPMCQCACSVNISPLLPVVKGGPHLKTTEDVPRRNPMRFK